MYRTAARITLAASKVNSPVYLHSSSSSYKTLNLFQNLTTNAQRWDFYDETHLVSQRFHQNSSVDNYREFGYSQKPNGVNGDVRGIFQNSQHFQHNSQETNFSDEYLHNPRVYVGNPSGAYAGKVVGAFNHSRNGYQFQLNPNRQMGTFALTDAKPDNDSSESSLYMGTVEELDAFCRENKVKEAVEVLEVLLNKGITVDMPRYVLLMQLCANIGVLNYAKSVHDHLVKSAGQVNVGVHNKILDMYANCGSMSDAYKVFENMTQRNLTSWDTMITGFAKNGYGEDAIDLFTQFKEAGMKPDGQMFIGVFLACSVLFDVNEGMLHFESMSKVYGVVPSMDHYVSVVSMLGSAGYLDEAKEFIEKMPIEPNADVWETLMNICRVHGNTVLGDHCEEIVNYLDPSRSIDKSKKGLVPVKISDVENEVEKKKLLNNLTDVKSKVYEFKAGDAVLPHNDRIYSLLRGMMAQMKEVGYVPNMKFVLHDVDDETKAEALLSHSERLALAQGVLTSPARTPIRIIKNLRVCGDCHAAMKFASKIIGRLIVMRDAKRFHHFSDGVCSCKDYW